MEDEQCKENLEQVCCDLKGQMRDITQLWRYKQPSTKIKNNCAQDVIQNVNKST